MFATKPLTARETGFSLVEVMVALLIGMIGVIVMMQIFALSESQKRSTTGASDAQGSGTIAMFGLQRDIQASGYGFSDLKLLGCDLTLPAVDPVSPALGRGTMTLAAIAPVTINHADIPAGDANTDTLLVISGNGNGSPQGDGIINQLTNNEYTAQTPSAYAKDDYVIAAPPTRATPCTLLLDKVSKKPPTNEDPVTVTTGVASMKGGTLFNLGQNPAIRAYAVRGGNLTVCDHRANDCTDPDTVANAAVWVPVANNLVSLRAEYGVDTDATMDGIVNTYNQTTATTACGWVKTLAVRIALVARSGQYEKESITASAPSWAGTSSTTAVPINLGGNSNWRHYRYKVFETTVPLRNITWMEVSTGC